MTGGDGSLANGCTWFEPHKAELLVGRSSELPERHPRDEALGEPRSVHAKLADAHEPRIEPRLDSPEQRWRPYGRRGHYQHNFAAHKPSAAPPCKEAGRAG